MEQLVQSKYRKEKECRQSQACRHSCPSILSAFNKQVTSIFLRAFPVSCSPHHFDVIFCIYEGLRLDPKYGTVLQKESSNAFIDLYVFNENELMLSDIEMANHFTSTWPASIFRLQRMCALPKSWGRVTLSDMELTVYRDGKSVSRDLPPGHQYLESIAENFGINLDAAYEDLAPLEPIQKHKGP